MRNGSSQVSCMHFKDAEMSVLINSSERALVQLMCRLVMNCQVKPMLFERYITSLLGSLLLVLFHTFVCHSFKDIQQPSILAPETSRSKLEHLPGLDTTNLLSRRTLSLNHGE